MSNLAHALFYAKEIGWPVFPIAPGKKVPAIKGGNGHLDATTDVDQITEWWSPFPDRGIGVSLELAGLAVIDFDPRNGGDPDGPEAARLIPTLAVSTSRGCADDGGEACTHPSGKRGRHLYYHLPPNWKVPRYLDGNRGDRRKAEGLHHRASHHAPSWDGL